MLADSLSLWARVCSFVLAHWECCVVDYGTQVEVLVDQVGVSVVHVFYHSLELQTLEQEWLVLVKQIVDVHFVGVHEVPLDK